MAQVSLPINGYGYFLGCADGEEDHLYALAADLDRRIEEIKQSTGPSSGEARLLLMAALMLSDELFEARQQQGSTPRPAEKSAPKIGRRLRGHHAQGAEAIAESVEAESVAAPPDHA